MPRISNVFFLLIQITEGGFTVHANYSLQKLKFHAIAVENTVFIAFFG